MSPPKTTANPPTTKPPTTQKNTRTLERLERESAREENAWWHEHAVAALQGLTFAETGNPDAAFEKMEAAHAAVLSELSAESVRDTLRRLLPRPPSSRHTVVTMTPRRPGVLLGALLRAQELWEAAGGGGGARGAAAAAAAVMVVAAGAVAALAVVALRRRKAAAA